MHSKSRIEFNDPIKRKLRERVAYMCCNPLCRVLTVKPNSSNDGIVRSGKASHIFSAAETGPRSNHGKDPKFIGSFDNGIWLCDKCSREIDDNEAKYPSTLLLKWKNDSELYVESLVTHDTRLRQLRIISMDVLSSLRILNAIPGPGSHMDHTFRDSRSLDLTRILIETEQILFENEFIQEANLIKAIKNDLEGEIYEMIRNNNDSNKYIDISLWKDKVIQKVMFEILRYSVESYDRYFETEHGMIEYRLNEIKKEMPIKKVVGAILENCLIK